MFSQFRQAVEGFAPPPPRKSGSEDLARSGSPGPGSPLSKSNSMPEARAPKSNLEERLRAKLAAAQSKSSVPAPDPVEHPLSPKSVPLPGSPILSSTVAFASEVDAPLSLEIPHPPNTDASTLNPKSAITEGFHTAQLSPVTPATDEANVPSETDTTIKVENGVSDNAINTSPLTKSSAVEEVAPLEELTAQNSRDTSPLANENDDETCSGSLETKTTLPEISIEAPSETALETLQNRLKLVEQRFSGRWCLIFLPMVAELNTFRCLNIF